ALRRSMMEETWDRFREDLMGNITRRFRDRDMVNLVSLCHARALCAQAAAIVDARDRVQYSPPGDPASQQEIDDLIDAIERNYEGGVKFCCINDLSWFLGRSDRLLPILERMSGPRLPFEIARTADAGRLGHPSPA
ncbi:MAG: hypothetical protein AB7P02_29075, partial [Alphaproteobacteria bacterium]